MGGEHGVWGGFLQKPLSKTRGGWLYSTAILRKGVADEKMDEDGWTVGGFFISDCGSGW
jgi:hypothetical protein